MSEPKPSGAAPSSLTLRRPDDWHVHFRDGAMLKACVPYTARQFARAIVMPNLVPPVTSVAAAQAYRQRILAAVPAGLRFEPLMTLYLTDDADTKELVRGHRDRVWVAAKLYPAHATTNSQFGVTSMDRIAGVLDAMEQIGMPLLVHGEVTSPDVDVFDREAVFLDRVLTPLLRRHQGLKIVLEHATTREAIDFVRAQAPRVAATLTPHHLMLNRNALFAGGLRPHHYCLPVVKREHHRLALRKAAVSGEACFFLGTDSAPHPVKAKEQDCGCAGIFSAPAALPLYAQVFAEEGALDRLEAFASVNGPRFYGLPVNEERITLRAVAPELPARMPTAEAEVVVFRADAPPNWSIQP